MTVPVSLLLLGLRYAIQRPNVTSGWSSQTMLMTLPRGAKAARLDRRPLMSSFHQATTTCLASLAAASSSEDSAWSMACTKQCKPCSVFC